MPDYVRASESAAERAEAVTGEPRNLADEETAVKEDLAEWEQMLDPEERTRLREETADEDKLTRTYEKAWRLAANCRIRNAGGA